VIFRLVAAIAGGGPGMEGRAGGCNPGRSAIEVGVGGIETGEISAEEVASVTTLKEMPTVSN
jgi:hypothetical protein